MTRTPYPCWGLKLPEAIDEPGEVVSLLLKWRKDDSWLLLGGPAAVSNEQLWTAWLALTSRFANSNMRANTKDAEFLRLISGTHQIRIGFERAGLQQGDSKIWLIHLPDMENKDIRNREWPKINRNELDQEANRLMNVFNATLVPHSPMPVEESVERLQLTLESGHGSDCQAITRAAIAHIALADFN
ncbi:MAG: hypothetical protein CMB37_00110 [Euryarchaeota archaeon]|jgi:tRNA threonylcarbamoyladenosine modification (KEOPS) complex Cgi121 subunit|nr:hypothetical protein [Euryarchaeota archaeon]MED5486461.1 hypothetical protein [Candidatus Thermoplasmatota archaeon]